MRQNSSSSLGKHRVAARVVQMVMRVHNEPYRQIRDLLDLGQQIARRRHIFERIHHHYAIAADDESCIAAGFAAIRSNSGINAFADFFNREVSRISKSNG